MEPRLRDINIKEFLILYNCILCGCSFHIKHERKNLWNELDEALVEAPDKTIHSCSDGRLGMADKTGARINLIPM